MDVIRISDKKMKIMLTSADMTLYDLDNDTLLDRPIETQKSFRNLLEDIRKQTGFCEEETQLSVQFFPSREGGCEMFLSSLPIAVSEEKKKTLLGKNIKSLTLQPMQKQFYKECAFSFQTLNALLTSCKRLKKCGFSGESCAFLDENQRYFLWIKVQSEIPFALPEELLFLNEYGYLENLTMFRYYIKEHGKPICEKIAVDKLSSFG